MIRLYTLLFSFLILSTGLQAQSLLDSVAAEPLPKPIVNLWKSSRLMSFATTQRVEKGNLEFRVSHRFGDIATPNSHFHTLFGFDFAEDILIHFEYGVTDRLALSAGRTKGSGAFKELWHGGIRFNVIDFDHDGSPVAVALYGNAVLSTQKADPFVPTEDWKASSFSQRLQYMSQVMIARPFGPITVQISPTFLYRNYVNYNDANGLLFVPVLLRGRINKRVSIVGEFAGYMLGTGKTYRGTFNFSDSRPTKDLWNAPLHIGVEVETGGHVFVLNLTNSSGILENDVLAYNNRSWDKGEWRFGFTILRWFQVGKRR
jgi:hypothetical protein